MSLRSLIWAIMLFVGVFHNVRADEGVVAKNGDRFSLKESAASNGGTIHELQRTSPDGKVTTLWRNQPRTTPSGFSESVPLFMSSVSAIYEGDGEISLLVREGEADGLVFRFPSAATTANPIRVRRLRMYGDNSRGLRFKQHGELIFDLPKNSIEKLIRFNEKGEIISDFRPGGNPISLSPLGGTPMPPDGGSAAPTIDQGGQTSASPLSSPGKTTTQPTNSGSSVASVVEPPLSSTSWPLWGGIMLGTVVLAYLLFKNRESKG